MQDVSLEKTCAKSRAVYWVAVRDWLHPSLTPLADELTEAFFQPEHLIDPAKVSSLSRKIFHTDLKLYREADNLSDDQLNNFTFYFRQAQKALDSGALDVAEHLIHKAQDVVRQQAPTSLRLISCLYILEDVHYERRDIPKMLSSRREMLDLYERNYGEMSPRLAEAFSQFASMLSSYERNNEAVLYLDRAQEILAATVGESNYLFASIVLQKNEIVKDSRVERANQVIDEWLLF